MITNKEIKLIKSLRHKKNRNNNNMFIAEGDKTILELIKNNFNPLNIYSINNNLLFDVSIISRLELKKISNLSNPKDSLGIFQIPIIKKVDTSNLIVSLDCVNDPGNLGTIVRACDWFGVKQTPKYKSPVQQVPHQHTYLAFQSSLFPANTPLAHTECLASQQQKGHFVRSPK